MPKPSLGIADTGTEGPELLNCKGFADHLPTGHSGEAVGLIPQKFQNLN